MATSSKTANFGTSPAFLMFLLFLGLKLCGVIDWSWWWVTAPLWSAVLAIPFLIWMNKKPSRSTYRIKWG